MKLTRQVTCTNDTAAEASKSSVYSVQIRRRDNTVSPPFVLKRYEGLDQFISVMKEPKKKWNAQNTSQPRLTLTALMCTLKTSH